MAKVVLTNLTNLSNETSVVNTINANNDAIEAAMEQALFRDGETPNEMNDDLDMNSNRIYNLPFPVSGTEPIRKAEYDQELGAISENLTLAEAAADAAEAALELFKGSWFGGLASDPSVDPNGDALNAGDAYYNTTLGQIRYYNGTSWLAFPVQDGLITRQGFIATAGQTTFTVAGGYTAPYLFVYYNGVLLYTSEYTATNGTTVVLTSGALVGAEISVVKFSAFSVANALTAANNLSDVADVSTARTNLGLGAMATKATVATTDIDNDAVTFTKLQNITDNRLLGRSAGSDGDAQHIVVGSGLSLSGGTLTASSTAPVYQDSGFELAASVAGNALTIALKTTSGTDATALDPINIAVTTSAGLSTVVATTAAKSVVVSSGSTLGTSNNVPFRFWVLLLANGEMAVVNCKMSSGVFALSPHYALPTITAEGGAGAADSSGTVYATTGTTNQDFAVLGWVEYSSGLATAGTYGSAPSLVRVWKPSMPLPNDVVQTRYLFESTGSSTTSTSLTDVTNATLSITPTSAANAVLLTSSQSHQITAGGSGVNSTMNVVLTDGSNSALGGTRTIGIASGGGTNTATNGPSAHNLLHYPQTASSFTYKLRHQSSVGTATATTSGIHMVLSEVMV